MTAYRYVQPLPKVVCRAGESKRLYSGDLSQFGGLVRFCVTARPVNAPPPGIGKVYEQSAAPLNLPELPPGLNDALPAPPTSVLACNFRHRDISRYSWMDLGAVTMFDVTAIGGEVDVVYPLDSLTANPPAMEYSVNFFPPSGGSLPLPVYTSRETPPNYPTGIVPVGNSRGIPIQPNARACTLLSTGVPARVDVGRGQYVYPQGVTGLWETLGSWVVEHDSLSFPVPRGANVVRITNTGGEAARIPYVAVFEVMP